MITKHETITVQGTVIYCDNPDCKARGPQAAYENVESVLEEAERQGWTMSENDLDLCPKCSPK